MLLSPINLYYWDVCCGHRLCVPSTLLRARPQWYLVVDSHFTAQGECRCVHAQVRSTLSLHLSIVIHVHVSHATYLFFSCFHVHTRQDENTVTLYNQCTSRLHEMKKNRKNVQLRCKSFHNDDKNYGTRLMPCEHHGVTFLLLLLLVW